MSRETTILVIDDDADLRQALVEQFELEEGFGAVGASSAAEGFTAAAAEKPVTTTIGAVKVVLTVAEVTRNEPDTALPTSCSFLTHEVPELHAVRLPGSAGAPARRDSAPSSGPGM